jgi:hypothetical protein
MGKKPKSLMTRGSFGAFTCMSCRRVKFSDTEAWLFAESVRAEETRTPAPQKRAGLADGSRQRLAEEQEFPDAHPSAETEQQPMVSRQHDHRKPRTAPLARLAERVTQATDV